MSDLSMNILGVVRNGGRAFEQTLACIERLRALLPDSQMIVATNDNTDGTDVVLERHAQAHKNVTILSLPDQMQTIPERVERIAAARNATLCALFDGRPVFPLTLILDLDGPNTNVNPQMVLTAAQRQVPKWDAVFANQLGAYYDIYALRCEGWCESDVWQTIDGTPKPWFFRKRRKRALLAKQVYDRQIIIPPTAPLIAVNSAFGGLGLYRTNVLNGLRYEARDAQGLLTCEHVTLHADMRAQGAALYIDPALINATQQEHLGPSSGAPMSGFLFVD